MRSVIKQAAKLSLSVLTMLIFISANAQDNTGAAKTVVSSNNQLAILLGAIALVLAFVIYGMGQVLVTLGKQLLEKNKQSNKALTAILLIGFSLLATSTSAQNKAASEVANVVPNYGGLDSTAFWLIVTVVFTEVVIILFLLFSIRRMQAELLPKTDKAKMMALKQLWLKLDKKIFTRAVAVEKEADVMLDHNYDGIRELDNALPPWWKYGFIITIVVAFVYLLNFHVLGYGKNPTEEYQEELVKAQEAKEIYESKNANKIDEANLKMPDEKGLAAGKELFTTVCWACHGKLGEGGAGPNLTDDYWIHKGSLSDVYQSIKKGYPDKGMQSWEKNYSPKEMNNLAGYIKTLKGTNPPNAKAPQGDLFEEIITVADSAKAPLNATKDSLTIKK